MGDRNKEDKPGSPKLGIFKKSSVKYMLKEKEGERGTSIHCLQYMSYPGIEPAAPGMCLDQGITLATFLCTRGCSAN